MLSVHATRSTLSLPHIISRSYAVSVNPPRVYERKSVPRRYSERKSFLYHQYTRMLQASAQSPMIFLQHSKFNVQRMIKLRREIVAASSRFAPSLSSPNPNPLQLEPPTLTVMRTSIFGVALREFAPLEANAATEIARLVSQGLAILTLPSLHPPQLDAILRALDRAVPPRKAETEQIKVKGDGDDPDFVPGRKPQKLKPISIPELSVVGAMIEGRVFVPQAVTDVSHLPTLETLRAQIVGLLSSPATQLAAVLSEASGGKLARTLEGLKKGLEEGQMSQPSS